MSQPVRRCSKSNQRPTAIRWLALAIAIVVDDAIVVVEDCSRLVDEGKLNARQAAEKAMEPSMGSANINRYNMYESASLPATPASAQNPGTSEAQPSANPADNQTNTPKVDK